MILTLKHLFSLFLLVTIFASLQAQVADTSLGVKTIGDTIPKRDSGIIKPVIKSDSSLYLILKDNIYLNSSGKPLSIYSSPRRKNGNEFYFYILAGLLLFLGFLKAFFSRYFTNLFRVFFNNSLRQTQLTDQLIQAKLPSLLFNIFFILSGGLYINFLLRHYGWIDEPNRWLVMGACIGVLGCIYLVKFCTLKFTGWITGFNPVTNSYIFVIFLINKIIGVMLIPFVIVLAFSAASVTGAMLIVSLICIGFLLILRFFRAYGLLQNQLKVSRFHFFLYIIGIEIVPLLLIYKVLVLLLSKNP